MTYTIAITGKGGTGKTTVSAFIIRLLLDKGVHPLLAVDADPNSSLAPLLGLAIDRTISDIRQEIMEGKSKTTEISKERMLNLKLSECVVEADGFDMLTMGRPEGASCYCYVNNLLRRTLSLLKANYKTTIVDNEAGMEHLSRMNMDNIDCLIVVSEPTVISARSVERIMTLARSLSVKIHQYVLVWNKVKDGLVPEAVTKILEKEEFDLTIFLPEDARIEKLSILEKSIFSNEAPKEFMKLLEPCIRDKFEILKKEKERL